jgi:antitoxin component YwqK of YwqJK toxin-antitoxin module
MDSKTNNMNNEEARFLYKKVSSALKSISTIDRKDRINDFNNKMISAIDEQKKINESFLLISNEKCLDEKRKKSRQNSLNRKQEKLEKLSDNFQKDCEKMCKHLVRFQTEYQELSMVYEKLGEVFSGNIKHNVIDDSKEKKYSINDSDNKYPLCSAIFHTILHECSNYVNDQRYVFKLCVDNCSPGKEKIREWLVIMQYLEDTLTNESRTCSDKGYAKFRGDKFEVIKIININDLSTKDKITNVFNSITEHGGKFQTTTIELEYIVGEIVRVSDYDENVSEVCEKGIHYYKSISAAFCYGQNPPTNYTGYWYIWNQDGSPEAKYEYVNGKRHGEFELWHNNNNYGQDVDQKLSSVDKIYGYYTNNKRSGLWTIKLRNNLTVIKSMDRDKLCVVMTKDAKIIEIGKCDSDEMIPFCSNTDTKITFDEIGNVRSESHLDKKCTNGSRMYVCITYDEHGAFSGMNNYSSRGILNGEHIICDNKLNKCESGKYYGGKKGDFWHTIKCRDQNQTEYHLFDLERDIACDIEWDIACDIACDIVLDQDKMQEGDRIQKRIDEYTTVKTDFFDIF